VDQIKKLKSNNIKIGSQVDQIKKLKSNNIKNGSQVDQIKKLKSNNIKNLNPRWIKYEEDLLDGAARWGRAHISSLSFHSVINVRIVLEHCKRASAPERRRKPERLYTEEK
jgi:hypothetical protein